MEIRQFVEQEKFEVFLKETFASIQADELEHLIIGND